jgi:hypothetical protein
MVHSHAGHHSVFVSIRSTNGFGDQPIAIENLALRLRLAAYKRKRNGLWLTHGIDCFGLV